MSSSVVRDIHNSSLTSMPVFMSDFKYCSLYLNGRDTVG